MGLHKVTTMEIRQKVIGGKVVNIYDEAIKRAICKEYINGSSSKMAVQRKYGIKFKSAIVSWLRIFGYNDPRPCFNEVVAQDQFQINYMSQPKQQDIQALEAKIRKLEQQLAEAELKATVYNTLINVAERDLKISIRKKPVTKQSTK